MGRYICTSSARPPCPLESNNSGLKIPLSSFVLTNSGEIVETRMEMLRERVRTVGISLLGGKSGVEGPYELGIDNIRAVNPEDVTNSHGTYKLALSWN
jgi:NADH dehydrogenase [ubiquinone] 1 alpha subcomplex assembly factor 1